MQSTQLFSLTEAGNTKYKEFNTKSCSPAEKYGRKFFEYDLVKSTILVSITKRNYLYKTTPPLRYSVLFSQRHGERLGLWFVDVLGKNMKACSAAPLAAGSPNFKDQR